MLKLLLVGVLVGFLTACTVKTKAGVGWPEVIIEPEVNVGNPHPQHCPPGHAKKGWC